MRSSHAFTKTGMAWLAAFAFLVIAAGSFSVIADTPTDPNQPPDNIVPDMVEEDWQLIVSNPDPQGVGPQVTMVMSPDSNANSPFIAFDLNYKEFPFFSPGGMQIQVWSDANVITTSTQGTDVLSTVNETVTWTQRLYVNESTVVFDVNNGQSTTWGQFGQEANLRIGYPTTLSDLGGYDPNFSAKRSGVTWESDRVKSLTLLQVRYYAKRELVWTSPNPVIVYSQEDD